MLFEIKSRAGERASNLTISTSFCCAVLCCVVFCSVLFCSWKEFVSCISWQIFVRLLASLISLHGRKLLTEGVVKIITK